MRKERNHEKIEHLKDFCSSAQELQAYLERNALRHNNYKIYGALSDIVRIRDKGYLYLSNGSNWNDPADAEKLKCGDMQHVHFGKCFSFSQGESVAMWMLYGGSHKDGGMIDFTKPAMNNIFKVSTVDVGIWEHGRFRKMKTLTRDSFTVRMTDIVYYKRNLNKSGETIYYLTHAGEGCPNVSADVFDSLSQCTKTHPWSYENECRLIVSVDKSCIPEECNSLRINLKKLNLGKSFERIYMSPTCTTETNEAYREAHNIQPSFLHGKVNWSLCHCRKCREKIKKGKNI